MAGGKQAQARVSRLAALELLNGLLQVPSHEFSFPADSILQSDETPARMMTRTGSRIAFRVEGGRNWVAYFQARCTNPSHADTDLIAG